MFSSAGDFEVEQEKSAARAAAPTSLFPFQLPLSLANPAMALARLPVATTSAATSSPSTTPNISTAFPAMMQNAFFQQMLQAMQFNRPQGALAAANPDSNNGSMVESRSSSTTGSPSTTKRLQTDADGNPICPVCGENIGGENNWRAHVELEKKKLVQMVESLKTQRSSPFDMHNIINMSYNQAAEKREKELQRIRSNQEKRVRVKNVITLSHLKDDKHSYTSATTEEVLDSRSGSTSSQHFGDLEKSYCKGCERQQEFLVLSNMLDEPRCMDCFQKRRQQIGGLPSTITQSPDEACKEDRTLSTPSRSNRTTPSSSTTSPINGRSSATENGHSSPLAARIKEELAPELPEKRQRLDLVA